jgi:hypothetical protein
MYAHTHLEILDVAHVLLLELAEPNLPHDRWRLEFKNNVLRSVGEHGVGTVVWSATNLADAFRNQAKHSEAEAMFCKTLAVLRRVLGPERGGERSVVPRGRRCPLFKTHTSGVRTHLWWTVAARRPPRRLIRRSVDNDVAAGHDTVKNPRGVRECVCV